MLFNKLSGIVAFSRLFVNPCEAVSLTLGVAGFILKQWRGVEQWKLVGLITRRSLVRIQPPLPYLGYYSLALQI